MRQTLRITGLGLALLALSCSGSSEQAKTDAPATETNEPAAANEDTADTSTTTSEEPAEAPPAAAQVDLNAVEDLESLFSVAGNLDRERVSGLIGQKKPDVYKCYSDALPANPGLAGRVLVQITTTPAGGVASAMVKQTTLNNATVEQCMIGKIRTWKFPDDPSGGLTIIKYGFQLPP